MTSAPDQKNWWMFQTNPESDLPFQMEVLPEPNSSYIGGCFKLILNQICPFKWRYCLSQIHPTPKCAVLTWDQDILMATNHSYSY